MKGHIDRVENGSITGWIYDPTMPSKKAYDLYINEVLITTFETTEFRAGVKKMHPESTGIVGFNIVNNKIPVDNIKIQIVHTGENIDNTSARFEHSVFQSDRVLIIGLAKSGTSILTYRIADALNNPTIHFEPNGEKGFNDLPMHKGFIDNRDLVTKSLFPWNTKIIHNQNIIDLYTKNIWIIRDPRDHLISIFFYQWYHKHNPDKSKFKKALDLVTIKEKNPESISFKELFSVNGSIKSFVQATYSNILEYYNNHKDAWYILQYEEFVDNKLDDLESYLGCQINVKVEVNDNINRVVRSKKYGNWKDWFTKEDVADFKEIFNPILDSLGYEKDWSLNENQEINADTGSKYMIRINSK